MANTIIQLKWSEVTSNPPSLNVAEPAYSNTSEKLFIGLSDNSVVSIGGRYYTRIIENATDTNTANTIVKRDLNGSFSANVVTANLVGNAATASKWLSPIDLGLSGDVTGNVSVDGSSNVTLSVELVDTGVSSGTYGGTTNIPVFTVDVDGRLTYAANVSVATTLGFSGDSGTGTLDLLTDTFGFTGGDGITTTANNTTNSILIEVDNTVVRTSGQQSIDGNLFVSGNLIISGNTVTQDVETMSVEDSLIQLAANNTADSIDIGFFGQYNDGSSTLYTTLFRDASDSGKYKLLTAGTEKPLAANSVNAQAFGTATLVANITGGTVSGLTQRISIADGGTNNDSFNTGNFIVFDGTKIASIANTGTAGTYANASHVPVITTDPYGRVSGIANTLIQIDTSQVITGILPIARGGTGAGSFAVKGVIVANTSSTTGAFTSLTSATEGHILTIDSTGTPVFGFLSGGSF